MSHHTPEEVRERQSLLAHWNKITVLHEFGQYSTYCKLADWPLLPRHGLKVRRIIATNLSSTDLDHLHAWLKWRGQ